MLGARLLLLLPFLANEAQAALTAATVAAASDRSSPGITVVLLNWARLRNNIEIVNTLSSPDISDIVHRIVVWNNNPRIVLTHHHFARSSSFCAKKLQIINSAQNVYFQARFLACAATTTEFCFLQDDDYIVLPGTIRSLHAHLTASSNLTATHLLPPHEHLATSLRTAVSADGSIHTGFAWLGHGAMLRRSAAVAFLQLLGELNLSDIEMKMADNYYTILSNSYPDVWIDDGTPLDGMGAFTVGTVGDERNWDHMGRALRYLERRLLLGRHRDPYVQNGPYQRAPPFDDATAICIGAQCTITSNIQRLPEFPISSFPLRMRDHERARRALLGKGLEEMMLRHPLSHAVDSSTESSFQGDTAARAGDFLTMDRLTAVVAPSELTIIVDSPTSNILRHTVFAVSQNQHSWFSVSGKVDCISVSSQRSKPADDIGTKNCALQIGETQWRFIRAHLTHDMQGRWVIFDIRLRHALAT